MIYEPNKWVRKPCPILKNIEYIQDLLIKDGYLGFYEGFDTYPDGDTTSLYVRMNLKGYRQAVLTWFEPEGSDWQIWVGYETPDANVHSANYHNAYSEPDTMAQAIEDLLYVLKHGGE